MRLIPIDSLTINADRQRQEFNPDTLQELFDSITSGQLLHAPVIRMEGETCILVAGERRLKAIKDIHALGLPLRYNNEVVPQGFIPVVSVGELGELEAEEAELDENLRRENLTWQEHAAAVQRLHNLRQKQKDVLREEFFGVGTAAPSEREFTQTVADTALEVRGRSDGSYQDSVRKEIIVAGNLHNPAVAKAKNVDEAFKILKKQETAERNANLAAAVGETFSAQSHKAFNVDCIKWLTDSPEGLFDVILTDPPYGMGAHEFGDGAGKMSGIEHHYDDSYESWHALMSGQTSAGLRLHDGWCKLAYRVAKPEAHAYVFCDIDNFHELKSLMQLAGWYVFRTPISCVKLNSGRVPLPDRGPRRQVEWILYAIKGNKPVTHIYPDFITASADENQSHGAQKPIAVYQNLLQRSIRPGDHVLDAFSGSGVIFPACHGLKCYATGLEREPEYYAQGLLRLQKIEKESLGGLEALL